MIAEGLPPNNKLAVLLNKTGIEDKWQTIAPPTKPLCAGP